MSVNGRKPRIRAQTGALMRTPYAPRWLSKDAIDEWRRVVPELMERKILTEADLGTLENYCAAIGSARECSRILQAEGHVVATPHGPKRHPASVAMKDAMGTARQLAAELGLTPVSRSRPTMRDDDDAGSLLDS